MQTVQQKIQILLKNHHEDAMKSYRFFETDLIQTLKDGLSSLETYLNKQLLKTISQLSAKLKSNYVRCLNPKAMYFSLDQYVRQEYKDVMDRIHKLKLKIQQYINEFSTEVLQKNIVNSQNVSLFHVSNKIKSYNHEWYSVTSLSLLEKAEIYVNGFDRPTTTWLALGLSKKKKQYGPVKNSISKQQFIGNIYLNGNQMMQGGSNYKHRKDLQNGDVFVIENNNRVAYMYRKNRGKNKEQQFILDDNIDYYFYIAFKGPITLEFHPF